ncbi:MAG: GtrA family protein [Deltaproteobacteria bacterium]|nr:GtrA family protein [Deltaproteobacteria bacterium]
MSTSVDVLLLLGGVHLLRLGTVPAAALGAVVGSLVSFGLNKYLAFRDRTSPLLPQLGRFAATVLAGTRAHGALLWTLVDRLRAPLLGGKLLADLLVFACGNLWMMRLLVFPAGPRGSASQS